MGKPKTNRRGDINRAHSNDMCQTPPYAVEPLLPYLNPEWVVWESAAGEGLLARALIRRGFRVIQTDIQNGQNFFHYHHPPEGAKIQVTNPPYRVKYEWIAHSYKMDIPFALLVPGDVLLAARAQKLFKQFGVEVIFLDKRVDFKMPQKGWKGSGAQFSVIWLTWGLEIGQQMTFAHLPKPSAQRRAEMAHNIKQLSLFKEATWPQKGGQIVTRTSKGKTRQCSKPCVRYSLA